MLVSELITRALRLINVPGRGAILSPDDQDAALEAYQDIVNAEAVSKYFVPGVRTHFFPLQPNKGIYTYGPGGELDTNDFGDPSPIKVEDGYVRAGSSITANEQVTSPEFVTATGWTTGTGWIIANEKATLSPGNDGETLDQTLGLVAGIAYTLKVKVTHRAGSVTMVINQDGSPILTQVLSGSATYEFAIAFAGTTSTIVFTADALADLDIESASIIQTGLDKVSLPDRVGSDYMLTIINQKRYNRRFSKGTGGRPYEIYYTRDYPMPHVRFDNAAIAGDILVLDVLVNRLEVSALSDTIKLWPDELKWLKYKLADECAGEYGKSLRPRQVTIMDEAWDSLAAGNDRQNNLSIDGALRLRPVFDINRGDP